MTHKFTINFATFLKNKKLVWRDFNELFKKFNLLIKDYELYSNEYYEHYKFLKEKNNSSQFLRIKRKNYKISYE